MKRTMIGYCIAQIDPATIVENLKAKFKARAGFAADTIYLRGEKGPLKTLAGLRVVYMKSVTPGHVMLEARLPD